MKVDEHSGHGVDIHILFTLQLNLHHALNHDLGHLGPLPLTTVTMAVLTLNTRFFFVLFCFFVKKFFFELNSFLLNLSENFSPTHGYNQLPLFVLKGLGMQLGLTLSHDSCLCS